jgi:hypothetical protein
MKRSLESISFTQGASAQRAAMGIKAWPGDSLPTRFHYVDCEAEVGTLRIFAEACVSYEDHAACVLPEFEERFGLTYLSMAIATSWLLESEGHILVTQRLKADYKNGGLHFSSGGFMTIEQEPSGDTRHAVIREGYEEVGLTEDEISSITCLGVAYDNVQKKPDAIFKATTNVPIEEIKRRKTDKENVNFWMPISEPNVRHLLLESAHSVVPMGQAALLLRGGELFGQDWLYEMNQRLIKKAGDYNNPVARRAREKEDIARVPSLLEELCGTPS